MSEVGSLSPPRKKAKAEAKTMEATLSERWSSLSMIMSRPSKFGAETGSLTFVDEVDYEPDPELHGLLGEAKVLCVGAGGLGCEIIKDLALSGVKDIHVIDLDTIDITNLNRQFLFRKKDVGQPKANVAAKFVNSRVPGVKVTPHFGKLQDFDNEWYKQFQCVIAGLDNLEARRFLNKTLCDLVEFDSDDGSIDMASVIPLIDGGTEGFKGQARVILPMKTSCFDCTASLFPKNKAKAVCTLETNPRQPEDCAIYVFMKIDDDKEKNNSGECFSVNEQVDYFGGEDKKAVSAIIVETQFDENASEPRYSIKGTNGKVITGVVPSCLCSLNTSWTRSFGGSTRLDKDKREHMMWLHEKALARAEMFNISGLSYDKTLGSVKNIIPAVASTNAIIAAACVHEAVKILTFAGQILDTYFLYNGQSMGGVDCNTLQFDRQDNCAACQTPVIVDAKCGESVTAFAERVVAEGLFDPPMVQPMMHDSVQEIIYASTGPFATPKDSERTLDSVVESMETITVSDKSWGTDIPHRKLKVRFSEE